MLRFDFDCGQIKISILSQGHPELHKITSNWRQNVKIVNLSDDTEGDMCECHLSRRTNMDRLIFVKEVST